MLKNSICNNIQLYGDTTTPMEKECIMRLVDILQFNKYTYSRVQKYFSSFASEGQKRIMNNIELKCDVKRGQRNATKKHSFYLQRTYKVYMCISPLAIEL